MVVGLVLEVARALVVVVVPGLVVDLGLVVVVVGLGRVVVVMGWVVVVDDLRVVVVPGRVVVLPGRLMVGAPGRVVDELDVVIAETMLVGSTAGKGAPEAAPVRPMTAIPTPATRARTAPMPKLVVPRLLVDGPWPAARRSLKARAS